MTRRREAIADAVRQRLLSGLHFGTLETGARLPSARVLAREFGADPRSVTAAYRGLASEGLLIRRPPSRSYFVAPTSAMGGAVTAGADWLAEVLAAALSRGVPVPRFAEHVRRSVGTRRLRAVCLECNHDQGQWLCRELQESFGLDAEELDLDELSDPKRHAAPIRRADLVVTTAQHAGAARRLGERFARPWIVVSLRDDLVREIRRLLGLGPLYFVGTDPRFADELRRLYADQPFAGNLRPVILGRDDPAAIPAGAPAYVMRTARDRLGGPPPQVRALATLRAFSSDTARALLGFMIRENVRTEGTGPW